ncbi:hypothetical protein B296_00052422, partial [Ensete ventricosum]
MRNESMTDEREGEGRLGALRGWDASREFVVTANTASAVICVCTTWCSASRLLPSSSCHIQLIGSVPDRGKGSFVHGGGDGRSSSSAATKGFRLRTSAITSRRLLVVCLYVFNPCSLCYD